MDNVEAKAGIAARCGDDVVQARIASTRKHDEWLLGKARQRDSLMLRQRMLLR